jgi:hypothetical protein
MYFEGVSQYFDAKRIVAKRICKKRNQYFPNNGEISDEVFRLSQADKQFNRASILFRMRLKALEIMQILDSFSPRLIGSVSTGRIKRTSDIDLHVFCDDIELLTTFLTDNHIVFEQKEVMVMKGNRPRLYQHLYLFNEFDIELSVYPRSELRVVSRSSTDGNPIVRMTKQKLERMVEQEHWEGLTIQSEAE